MANKQFGSLLRRVRKSQGLTQQQVADLLGLSNKSTLGSWEIGKGEPNACMFLRLLQIYKVTNVYETFDELFQDKNYPVNVEIVEAQDSSAITSTNLHETCDAPRDGMLEKLESNYNRMNLDGQEQLVDYSEFLVGQGKYIKRDSTELVKEA